MQSDSKILIVGANGAMGGFTLLKLYGNKNLSVLILPSEREIFTNNKLMREDQWYPSDTTFINKKYFVFGREPSQDKEIGIFTSEILPENFFQDSNGVVFIASKIFHYEGVVEAIRPILHENIPLVNIVNGLKPEKTLENICRKKGIMNPIIRAVVMGGTHFTFNNDTQCLQVYSGIANFIIGNWDKSYSPEYRDILNYIVC
ncbi:MAG: 2-dehydropantoate 2-reductase N-terminal domain-containing protein, partial [Chitinispirillia bacterium]